MNENQLLYKLAFHFLPSIGAVNAKNLISYCGGLEEVFKAKKSTLLKVPGIGEKRAEEILKSNPLKAAEKELINLQKLKIEVLFYLDEAYPQKLKHFQNSPVLLFTKGNINLNHNRIISIVGTRKVTPQGISNCEKLIDGLKEYNCLILSGMAYGVDTIAHRHAVKLSMPTVAVLGHGLDTFYPASNRSLANKMLETGGLISEYTLGTKPDKVNFPRRNRVIASLAEAVVVIESAKKGGSIITAEYANEYNKDVFAFPGRTNDEYSEGCNNLIKTHKAHLCTSANDLAYIMRWEKTQENKQLQLALDLSEKEQEIYDLIKENPNIGLDILHYKTQRALATLTSELLSLEFKGVLKTLPGKKYILTS